MTDEDKKWIAVGLFMVSAIILLFWAVVSLTAEPSITGQITGMATTDIYNIPGDKTYEYIKVVEDEKTIWKTREIGATTWGTVSSSDGIAKLEATAVKQDPVTSASPKVPKQEEQQAPPPPQTDIAATLASLGVPFKGDTSQASGTEPGSTDPLKTEKTTHYITYSNGLRKPITKEEYATLVTSSASLKEEGITLDITKSNQDMTRDGVIITKTTIDGKEIPATANYNKQTIRLPGGSVTPTNTAEFYAMTTLDTSDGAAKIEKTDKGFKQGDMIVDIGENQIFSREEKNGKFTEAKIIELDSNGRVTGTITIDCNQPGGCDDPKKDYLTAETRDTNGMTTMTVERDQDGYFETNMKYNKATNTYQIKSTKNSQDGASTTYQNLHMGTSSVGTREFYTITTNEDNQQVRESVSVDDEGKLYTGDDKNPTYLTDSNGATITLSDADKDRLIDQYTTAQHGGSMNYFGDVLGTWGDITSGYSGMSLFYDEPDPVIELDQTMSDLLGGIDGWTSMICQSEMTDALDNGMAFSRNIGGPMAHIEGERVLVTNYDGTGSEGLYKISVTVDPGTESAGCDIGFQILLGIDPTNTNNQNDINDIQIIEGKAYYIDGTEVPEEYYERIIYSGTTYTTTEDGNITEVPGLIAVLRAPATTGNMYITVNSTGGVVPSSSPHAFDVKKGEAAFAYSGSNMIFFKDEIMFDRACIKFTSFSGTDCLVGVMEDDTLCNALNAGGEFKVAAIDDACDGGFNFMLPNCWG